MCRYVEELRATHCPDGGLVVILDTYSAHRTDAVKSTAAQLGIRLEFIPPGCTDLLEPLDRRIFGVLKSDGRQHWREHSTQTGGRKTTRKEMADSLLRARAGISP
jgi:hypothetical protein